MPFLQRCRVVAEKRKAEMLMINPLDITRLCDKAKRAKLHAALHSQDREYDLQKAARQVSDAKADVLDAAVELGNSMQRERVAQPAAQCSRRSGSAGRACFRRPAAGPLV